MDGASGDVDGWLKGVIGGVEAARSSPGSVDMAIPIEQLVFPILILAGDVGVGMSISPEALVVCSNLAAAKKRYAGATFVSADGAIYHVTDVARRGYAGPFFGWSFAFGFQIRVDVRVEEIVGGIPMDELRGKVLAALLRDRDGWNDTGCLRSAIAQIRGATTAAELVNAFRPLVGL